MWYIKLPAPTAVEVSAFVAEADTKLQLVLECLQIKDGGRLVTTARGFEIRGAGGELVDSYDVTECYHMNINIVWTWLRDYLA